MFTAHTLTSITKALVTKRSPFYVQFYINGTCNLQCRQCNIVETNSRIEPMDLEQVEAAATNMKKVGVGIVLLTGGEPFMHPNLPEIVKIFTSKGMNVRLQTAGTKYATNEKLMHCYENGARDINVSLDSLNIATSDYINATPGSGKNAIDAIERISNIFRNESAILSFGTVLSRFNYREIPSILEFAKQIGWFVSMVPVHISTSHDPRGFRSFDRNFKFSPEHKDMLNNLAAKLIGMKRGGYPLFDSEKFIESSVSFLMGDGPTWRKNGVCDSPNLYFAVRPNGAFSTCCDFTLKEPPYLYDEKFSSQYRSREIEQRSDVQKIVKSCAGCHYGSYPEVTLSVRNPKAFFERALLTTSMSSGKLKNAPVKENFLAETERIMALNTEVYPVHNWLDPDLIAEIAAFSDSDRRREIIKRDIAIRGEQNRVRGLGPDVPLTPS